MDGVKNAIKKTKDYANNYGHILNDNQLFLRLISPKIYSFKEVEGQGIKSVRNTEWKNKLILAQNLVDTHLSKIRGITMVGITGSVAAETAKINEDIDMLIITKRDELWWWRLFLRFYVWWLKIPHRRFGEKEKKNEFCFNLWLDEANLEIPKEKRNLKNATDLVMMKVIFDKNKTYQKFLENNKWVKKYLATGYEERRKIERRNLILETREEKNYLSKKIINSVLFWGQYIYMWSKSGRIVNNVKKGQAFFHKKD